MKSLHSFAQKGRRLPPPEVAEVLVDYSKALELPVGFDDPPASWRWPPRDGRLWCINNAAPLPPALFGRIPILKKTHREVVFGVRLPKEACSVIDKTKRPGRGKFVHDDDRLCVVEVKRTSCYLPFDLLSWPAETAALVLRKVLDASLAASGEGLAEASRLSAEARQLAVKAMAKKTMSVEARWAARRESEARSAFKEVGASHSSGKRNYLESEIASLEDNLREFSRRITADSRRLIRYQRELASLDGEEQADPVDFAAEYEQIRTYPLVHDLSVEDDLIVVTTLPLTTTYEGERIHLGRFAIEINLNGDVSVTNLTRRLWNFDHPHIRDGNPCLGNIQEGVAKLIGTYQLAAVSQVLIDFLQLVNPKEWVVSVEYWRES